MPQKLAPPPTNLKVLYTVLTQTDACNHY